MKMIYRGTVNVHIFAQLLFVHQGLGGIFVKLNISANNC